MTSATMISTRVFLPVTLVALVLCIGVTQAVRCYKCGQYNDGVGSITPCINHTAQMHLKECPSSSEWCIKYVSEGSTVRDCVTTCVEKETWSTRSYCCNEDGCNSGHSLTSSSATICIFAAALILLGHSLRG
ncbi:uncharacterized protein LOC107268709 [Cephus cinctus]|uniref:Uncharacterized protein LOC107268709 n=1 Tax=Cephus cinctus TaxID=211228 RepID=A0AAJ7BZ05_CEPCN|nr:uncharacterized protein LOC107268709 [Cephus cinctus]